MAASDGGSACHVLIDVGGHAARAALCRADGSRQAVHERPLQTHHGDGGIVEHDAMAVLAAVRGALDDVVAAGRHDLRGRLVAAGLSCQRASVVAWERDTGRALSPVLSWADSRAANLLDAAELDGDAVRRITGLRPTPFFGASKLAWLWRHRPAIRTAAAAGKLCWGPLASFLLHGLLAERPYCCSASLAQRSMLFDLEAGSWSAPLCAAFGIDPAGLPSISADIAPHGTLHAAEHTVPLMLCAGDQNLVPVALGGADPQRLALNLGTGAFVFRALHTGMRPDPELLASALPSARLPPALVQEGTVNGAGAAFDWLAKRHGGALPWASLAIADESAPLFLNTVGGLGSPLWRAASEPRFSAPPRDLLQAMAAVGDSIVFLLMLNIERLCTGGAVVDGIDVGGGLSRSEGLCQRLADVSGLGVRRHADNELSLRGLWRLLADAGDSAAMSSDADVAQFVPGPLAASRRQRFHAWREAIGT